MTAVAIVTMPGDFHAHAVCWSIRRLGGTCELFYPLDIVGESRFSFYPDRDKLFISGPAGLNQIPLDGYDSIWMRRAPTFFVKENIVDDRERSNAEEEFDLFVNGVLSRLESGKFVVNPLANSRLANRKAYQLSIAQEVGFSIPHTLISTDKQQILEFFERCGGEFIYKPLKAAPWSVAHTDRKTAIGTSQINDRNLLNGADLQSCPGIYQEKIAKRSEIRATVMGKSIFAWSKTPFDPYGIHVDWRRANKDVRYSAVTLPEDIAKKCFHTMDLLEIVFGCFDIAVDESGEYYFLEINPQGQWLNGDLLDLGFNQLGAFSQFLMSGDSKFCSPGPVDVDLQQYDRLRIFGSAVRQEERYHSGMLKGRPHLRVAIS